MVKQIALLLLLPAMVRHTAKFTLPESAAIQFGKPHLLAGYDPAQEPCTSADLFPTAKSIRRMFATYHELKPMELHDEYLEGGCAVDGKIVVKGKTYTLQIRPVNLLFTTWPDGQNHQLGGKTSDTNQ